MEILRDLNHVENKPTQSQMNLHHDRLVLSRNLKLRLFQSTKY